jgi:transposase-like protein
VQRNAVRSNGFMQTAPGSFLSGLAAEPVPAVGLRRRDGNYALDKSDRRATVATMSNPKATAPRKSRSKKTEKASLSLMDLVERFPTPLEARAYLESIVWANGRVCPHCGVVDDSADLHGAAAEKGLYWCRSCERNFTVMIGTIFEDSKIPLHKWIIAYHLIVANKKGISALSLQRMLGLGSYRSAWHMCHRIRHTMKDLSTEPLTGTVEVDETFIGGKAKNVHNGMPVPPKTPVLALVQRNGNVKTRAITNVDHKNIAPILDALVDRSAILMTDDAQVYVKLGGLFTEHHSVNHSASEYVRDEGHVSANTQTVESFNALVKRSIIGAWHNISDRHLDKYLDEVGFRWNTRDDSDGKRMEQALRQSAGRRLSLFAASAKEGSA